MDDDIVKKGIKMTDKNLEALFQDVLDRVLNDDISLPSMPEIGVEVRTAISCDNTTCDSLTAIIAKDPALTAYLVKVASSPVYRRAIPPKTLTEVVGLLGFTATSSMVMMHCAHNLVKVRTPAAKELFNHTWERLVIKTAVASFLSQYLKFGPMDQVQLAMLLTEVGSMSVLSTMLETSETPDSDMYFQMCRQYSKRLGGAALKKWEIDPMIVDLSQDCGEWDKTWEDKLNLLDIANLALYYTVKLTSDNPSLPNLDSIAAFAKIPEDLRTCSEDNWLDIIKDNDEEIQNIVSSFK